METVAAACPTAVDRGADAPIAATHLWCLICAQPKPYRNKPMAEASRQRRPGLHGEHLVCQGCGTALATCYVKEES